jgi:glutathione S-transferase
MHQLYFRDDPAYKGVYSVPLLWDKKTQRIVNNESAEMLAWLPSAFNPLIADQKIAAISFHPPSLRAQIDDITPWLTSLICSGVYKAGFNSTQAGYDAAVVPLFAALNKLEALVHANGGPYILGDTLTALDLLAYPTIVRFDAVYVQHFKTNLGIIRHDYPVLNNWLKGLYWHVEGFRESTDFLHIKENVSLSFVGVCRACGLTRRRSIPKVIRILIRWLLRPWDRIPRSRRGLRGIGVSCDRARSRIRWFSRRRVRCKREAGYYVNRLSIPCKHMCVLAHNI